MRRRPARGHGPCCARGMIRVVCLLPGMPLGMVSSPRLGWRRTAPHLVLARPAQPHPHGELDHEAPPARRDGGGPRPPTRRQGRHPAVASRRGRRRRGPRSGRCAAKVVGQRRQADPATAGPIGRDAAPDVPPDVSGWLRRRAPDVARRTRALGRQRHRCVAEPASVDRQGHGEGRAVALRPSSAGEGHDDGRVVGQDRVGGDGDGARRRGPPARPRAQRQPPRPRSGGRPSSAGPSPPP